jgi:hypothetical protein
VLDFAHTEEEFVQLDRRSDRDRRQGGSDRRKTDDSVLQDYRKGDRRKTPRRRQIDPTTCERDYSADEIEFMQALDAYKRRNGRMFPTCSEILEVVRALGYAKVTEDGADESETQPALSAAIPAGQGRGPDTNA